MPELPEVTTTVNGLKRTIKSLVIQNVWTDLAKDKPIKQFVGTVKDKKFFKLFQKKIKGTKILDIERRAKNILIHLSNKTTILIHLKMTGHLLFGEYKQVLNSKKKVVSWIPNKNERKELHDPYNRFVHVVFSLSKGKSLVFCDSRKFGKVTLFETAKVRETVHLKNLGPEPLDEGFKFEDFKERLSSKPNKNIKTLLMDQSIIVGIGNIYSDEMLWLAGIHPESKIKNIPLKNLKLLFVHMKKILKKGIDFGGDSMSDYRNVDGKRGNFQNEHNVYQKNKERCGKKNCLGVIIRKVIDGRSAHFCNIHQK